MQHIPPLCTQKVQGWPWLAGSRCELREELVRGGEGGNVTAKLGGRRAVGFPALEERERDAEELGRGEGEAAVDREGVGVWGWIWESATVVLSL